MHRFVAFVAVVAHVLFIGFTLLGGFLAWLMPWVLVPHVLSALWGGVVLAWRRACPLSVAENWARAGSGRPRLPERGFIAHYFEGRVYPAAWARRVEIASCGLVFGSWLGFALR